MHGMPLSRARAATAAAFGTQGLVLLSLTTRLPDFQDRWHLSDVTLSLVLLMMILLAGLGSVLAESAARRRSSSQLLRTGLVVVAVGVATLCLAPGIGLFVAGIACYGVGLGIVDASSNMQAVALEHRYGRPILPSFHGAWTLGGVIGAAITLGTSHLALEAGAVVALIPLLAAWGPFLPREQAAATAPGTDAGEIAVPWRPIVLVGVAMVLFYMVDTSVQTWGPLFLDHTFATPERYVALAALTYLLASGLVRLAGDRLVARFGAVAVLRLGALVGAVALAIVVFSPTWQVAVVGFAVLGAGVATIAPLSFSAAARIAGGEGLDPALRQARVDAVIARFNQFNYVGALLGSVMTGLVGSGSLRIGFAVPMILVLGIIPLAPAFAPRIAARVLP